MNDAFEIGQRVKIIRSVYTDDGIHEGQFGYIVESNADHTAAYYEVKAEEPNNVNEKGPWPFYNNELEAA